MSFRASVARWSEGTKSDARPGNPIAPSSPPTSDQRSMPFSQLNQTTESLCLDVLPGHARVVVNDSREASTVINIKAMFRSSPQSNHGLIALMKRALMATGFAAGLTLTNSVADAAVAQYELPSVMVITKSSNRNEVHYAAAVDDACAPVTNAPIRPYWQMLERGPNVTETLSSRELGVLGVTNQEVLGDEVSFAVNGMPSKTFVAHIGRDADRTCTSWVDTTIGGTQARLVSIHVKERFLGVDYVLLTGRTQSGRIVEERVHP
jgi:hypothetical protein